MHARTFAPVVSVVAVVLSGIVIAQSPSPQPDWETLARAPLPDGVEPILSINSLALPAEAVPRITQPHTHSGPVIAYILKGEIENQIEPEPPIVHKSGSFFIEPPMHVHKMLRNVSAIEPAMLIVSQVGRTAVPDSLTKTLEDEPVPLLQFHFGEPAPPLRYQFKVPLRSTKSQEFKLLRLTLPAGASADFPHTGPALIYVLEGMVRTMATAVPVRTYVAGELFLDPAYRAGVSFRNTSKALATLLLYQIAEKSGGQ
jgi:quercetin dioxygenase-like cupin family protein